MSTNVALLGAGGKMGCRIADNIGNADRYDVDYVEPSEEGRERLSERGLSATSQEAALDGADFVVLAVPDELIGQVSDDVAPAVESGTVIVLLDPAAAYAGVLHDRDDVTYFVTHPCHPSFFTADTDMDDPDTDWFGGQGRDQQDIVCALHAGPDEDYAPGEALARDIFAPVRRSHRITTEQMAVLEPALVESLAGGCIEAIRQGLDRAVEMGVPEQAARDFLFGHLRIDLGIIFGFTDFPFSDGAQHAIAEAKDEMFVSDWEDRIFDPERVRESTADIASSD